MADLVGKYDITLSLTTLHELHPVRRLMMEQCVAMSDVPFATQNATV